MRIQKHPSLQLWLREDGAVCLPPDGHRFFKFRWTYGYKDKKGYLQVGYRGKQYKVHRLVAETFIPNPNGYKEVDHYPDRNRSNNAVSNLRWASRKMQNDNRQVCEDSLKKYGVRFCEDKNAYQRAQRAEDPERYRAYQRKWYAKNTEQASARYREYCAKQRLLGKRRRRCPDGSCRFLTDEEYNKLYNKEFV